MATATETRYTPNDLLVITDRPMPELVDGQLVERTMGQRSDAIALLIAALLSDFVRTGRLGLVNGSQGSYQVFPDDPDKVRIPDASFTRRERLPMDGPAKGHARVVPDLVVEVVSPNDTSAYMSAKIEDFLRAGVPVIWEVRPESRTIIVWRTDGTALRLKAGDVLNGGDILPGFRCPVDVIFGELNG